jgi:hypothetical protein
MAADEMSVSTDAPLAPAGDERARLDYEHTTELLRTLTDTRFKLLAFVPTIAGASVGLLGHPGSALELLAVGLLGLVATLGVLVYELRNTQIYGYATARAVALERRLGVASPFDPARAGGLFTERPPRMLQLYGISVDHQRALALVYGAAVAGWSYLVAWGLLRGIHVANARSAGAAIGAAAGLLVVLEVARMDASSRPRARPTSQPGSHPTHAT